MKLWILMPFLCLCFLQTNAQDEGPSKKRPIELSFEFQMYPAGMMPGIRAEVGVGQYYKHSLEAKLAYNRARRNGWGEHGDERGGGFGGSFGYKYFVIKPMQGLYLGARTDIWNLNIKYRDIGSDEIYDTMDDSDFGQSNILILQPTAILGYKFLFKVGTNNTIITLTPQIAAGWEYNAKTSAPKNNPGTLDGEAVGQGAIGLWGIDIGIRF